MILYSLLVVLQSQSAESVRETRHRI